MFPNDAAGTEKQYFAVSHSGQAGGTTPRRRHSGRTLSTDSDRQIQTEKQALIIAGKIKKEKPLPEIAEDEVPFDIPESWKWVRLQDVVYPVGNKNNQILAKEVKVEGLYPAVSQGSAIFEGYSDNKEKVINDLPLVMFGDHTRNVKYIDFPFVICADGTKFMKAICVYPKYIYYWMSIVAYARHFLLLTKKNIPLPPLAEQKRIVAKIEELLPLVDRYEQAWQRLEVLNSRFPVDMQKSVLQLAIQGRLVPQRPEEGTAEDLFRQIQSEKEQIKRERNIKWKVLPELKEDELPYDIPETWRWVRLGDIISIESGKGLTAAQMIPGNIPVYGGNGITGYHNASMLHEETVVIGRVGFYCGSVHITEKESWVTDNAFITTYPEKSIDRKFLVYMLKYLNLGQNNNATAQPVVSGKKIYPIAFPLPPLAEQKRIVARLEELLPLCEMLR